MHLSHLYQNVKDVIDFGGIETTDLFLICTTVYTLPV